MLTITVTHVDILEGATILHGEGYDADGVVVEFVGEWRAMHAIAFALEDEAEVPATIERWQLIA